MIEKGQYNLVFTKKELSSKSTFQKRYYNFRVSLRSILLFLGIIILSLFSFFLLKWNKPFNMWHSFTKDNTTLCVIADQYIVVDESTINPHFALYPEINSVEQLGQFKADHPETKLSEANFTMMSKMAPYGIHYLDQWFYKLESSIVLKLESNTQFEDYANNNVIYIGQYKTMTTSRSVFLKNSKHFEAEIDGYIYKDKHGEKKYHSTIYGVNYQEYVMVSYQKLENGNHTLFIVSNHDIGVLGALKIFTNEDSLNDFIKKLPSSNCYFNALFEVNGLKRNEIDTKLIALEIVQ